MPLPQYASRGRGGLPVDGGYVAFIARLHGAEIRFEVWAVGREWGGAVSVPWACCGRVLWVLWVLCEDEYCGVLWWCCGCAAGSVVLWGGRCCGGAVAVLW